MRHEMKLTTMPFEQIAKGAKIIESRLYDDKRKKITVGDEIEFSENENPTRKIRVRVIDLLHYQTFKDMFAEYEASLFGGESKESLLTQIHEFYSVEDEKKFGVVGIKIELID